MHKTRILTALMLVLALAATATFAAGTHLKKKPGLAFIDDTQTSPVATGCLTLTASGSLTGLGNGDVAVTLSAVAQPNATCTNPGTGEHQPPGRNPALVTLGSSLGIPGGDVKNGNTPFTVTTIP